MRLIGVHVNLVHASETPQRAEERLHEMLEHVDEYVERDVGRLLFLASHTLITNGKQKTCKYTITRLMTLIRNVHDKNWLFCYHRIRRVRA